MECHMSSTYYNLNTIILFYIILLKCCLILFKDPHDPDKMKDYNTANWVGFKKSTANVSLLNLLKGYIC